MIEVYPNKLPGSPIETHQLRKATTVRQWLLDNVKGYEDRESPPISVEVNGDLIDPENWSSQRIRAKDDVRIFVEPKGAELIIAAVTLGAALKAVTALFTPAIPKQRGGGPGQGERLSNAAIKGNFPSLNSPIREIFGKRRVYPDFLLPQRRYFSSPRELVVESLFCVGVGDYDINPAQLWIGDTPAIALGADVDFAFYPPGANLSADERAIWWHSATEIGATSTGTAGVELRATTTLDPNPSATTFVFSGSTITIPGGAGSFPDGWTAGQIVRIDVRYPYTVADNTGTGGRDVITGDITQLALPDGALIEITGPNADSYIVFDSTATELELDYANSDPATELQTGSLSMGIGYRGLRYRLLSATSSTITVERLTDTGATDSAWPGFSSLTSYDAMITLDGSNLEGDWSGPFAACPDGEVTDTIEFDVMFPGGLFRVNKYNNPESYPVTVELQYRDIETAGSWTSVKRTYTTSSIDQIGFTERVNLGSSFRPECRMRRIGADSAETSIVDTVQWYGLRSKLNAPTSYEGVTVLAMSARSGNRLASQSETLVSCEVTRILPARLGGTELGNIPTRNPADAVRYIAKSVGYTDSDIDMVELDRLADVWHARGDWFDDSINDETTAKEAINDALRIGFAELSIDGAKIRPVRDEPRTTYEAMYSPQNMLESGQLVREFQAITPDDTDGVDVEYFSAVTNQWETVQCRLPGDIGAKVEKIRVDGVTDETRAWRIGMRRRRQIKYQRWVYKWGTEMDALNSRYMSYVAVGDDIPGYSQSAIMEAYDSGSQIITSSEPFNWEYGETHIIAVRRPDGSLSGPYFASQVGEFGVAIVPALDFVPDLSWQIEPPHLLFGTSTRWAFPVLIRNIMPNGLESASVEAVNYDERVYADDNNAPP